MVKRSDTPPPSSEEPRILCVKLPYPEVQPIDFEVHGGAEVILAQWLAQIIKKDSLFYIYWMPRNDMILVSVAREKDGFYNSILGEHRWGAFLKNCRRGWEKHVSTIFYSTYNTDRDVQRSGWRQKWIEASWFDDDYSSTFVHPYPDPIYTTIIPDSCRAIPAARRNVPVSIGASKWLVTSVDRDVPGAPVRTVTEDKKKRKKYSGQVGSLPYV
ncbi:hypothetical protein DACRYDRAFT_112874 [Dacryopinax primogenitus]|uniref:Uncharacterized protein n=1 Tax=Dacryopinax primogenitus (strain DJM 731) TaxID=1858805 RepID=M5G782_DACPD|nr:uncharacterized protein DACRYDRAFT_112874 [Dacryopinax primogenitus]EJU06096.1 hypothetical protein DACRYDRAFT_112874 [Dacryopinax primogenitus]